MKKAIKCLFSLIFISNLNAQENSIEIPNIHTLHSIHRINDTVDFVIARMNSQNTSEFSLFKFDKSNNTFDSLGVIPSNLNNSPFIITNEGVALSTRFYQGNDLFHRVYWIGLDGQIVEAGNFNSIRLFAKQNEFVYFSVAQPSNSFQLRRLNITTGTVSIIANTEHEFMFQLPDTSAVFFAARNPQGNLSILKYENGVDLQTLLNSELPVSLQFSHYRGFFDNKYFISQSSQYWEISLNPVELNLFGSIPTIPYQFNTYHTLPDSVFYTQRWEFIQFYGPKYYVVKGSIHNNILDTIPFSSALSPYRPRIESFIDGKYANGYTYKHGSEIFMITDSVYLVSDLAPGIQNGRLGGIFHKLNTDSSIVSMTNRMDSLVYLYALNDSLSQSYYPITYEGSLSATRYFDNYLYWYYVHENKFIIKYRSLLENFSPQPTEQEIIDNDVWARNLFYVHETSFSDNINQTQQLSNIKLLEDGSVIVATRAADSHQYKIVDENYHVIDDAFGGFILYKLDFQGNLIWHYSSGAQHYGSFAAYQIIRWDK